MKIILVVKEIEGGGIQKSYLTLFNSFLKYGHEAYLFVLTKPKKLTNLHKNIIILNGHTKFQKGLQLKNYLKKLSNIDLAIINAEYMKKYIPISQDKIFFTVHVIWSHRLGKGINKFFKLLKLKYRYYNENIITVSDGIKKDLMENIKIKPKTIKIIPDSYDIDEINKLSHKKIDIKDDFIVAVGSLLPVKRYDLLIKSFSMIKNKTIKLIIVGSGKEKDNIINLINKYKLQKRIILKGFDENPYKYIKNAKLLVLSSDSEGFSRVIIESLILKTPIVSTDCSPIFKENFFSENLKKFIVPKNNAQLLAQKIEQALNDYPKINNEFCYTFSDKNIINQYIGLIQNK